MNREERMLETCKSLTQKELVLLVDSPHYDQVDCMKNLLVNVIHNQKIFVRKNGMLKSNQTMAILKSKHDTFENNKKRYYSTMHVCKYTCPNITIRNNKVSKKTKHAHVRTPKINSMRK